MFLVRQATRQIFLKALVGGHGATAMAVLTFRGWDRRSLDSLTYRLSPLFDAGHLPLGPPSAPLATGSGNFLPHRESSHLHCGFPVSSCLEAARMGTDSSWSILADSSFSWKFDLSFFPHVISFFPSWFPWCLRW